MGEAYIIGYIVGAVLWGVVWAKFSGAFFMGIMIAVFDTDATDYWKQLFDNNLRLNVPITNGECYVKYDINIPNYTLDINVY